MIEAISFIMGKNIRLQMLFEPYLSMFISLALKFPKGIEMAEFHI